jgi:hypothetical protein
MWEPVRELHQAKLEAAGLGGVKLVFGRFKAGGKTRFEARLKGGTPEEQRKAREMLPFSDTH